MKTYWLFFLCLSFLSLNGSGEETPGPADVETIEVDWVKVIKNAPNNVINFYDNMELKGDPLIVLDSVGALIKGKRSCWWYVKETKVDIKKFEKRPQELVLAIGNKESELAFGCGTWISNRGFAIWERHGNVLRARNSVVEGRSYKTYVNLEYAPGKKLGVVKPSASGLARRIPGFVKFEQELHECVKSAEPEKCVDKFLSSDFAPEIRKKGGGYIKRSSVKAISAVVKKCLEVSPVSSREGEKYQISYYGNGHFCYIRRDFGTKKNPLKGEMKLVEVIVEDGTGFDDD